MTERPTQLERAMRMHAESVALLVAGRQDEDDSTPDVVVTTTVTLDGKHIGTARTVREGIALVLKIERAEQ